MTIFKSFKYPYLILCLILLNVVLVVWSCGGGKNNRMTDPTIPYDENSGEYTASDKIPILPSAVRDENVIAGTGLMGLFHVTADSGSEKAELSQMRTGSALGDPHNVDITSFMQGSFGKDCFSVKSVSYNDEEILRVSFLVSHPFDMPQNDPPLGNDRFDLHVFDLMATVFMEDGEDGNTSFPDTSSQVAFSGGARTLSSDNSGFWAFEEWDGCLARLLSV